ncbi:MAG: hypothetical protein WBL35_00475 [Ornithinibacter sp.]
MSSVLVLFPAGSAPVGSAARAAADAPGVGEAVGSPPVVDSVTGVGLSLADGLGVALRVTEAPGADGSGAEPPDVAAAVEVVAPPDPLVERGVEVDVGVEGGLVVFAGVGDGLGSAVGLGAVVLTGAGGAARGCWPDPKRQPSTEPGAGLCEPAPLEEYVHDPPRSAYQYAQ